MLIKKDHFRLMDTYIREYITKFLSKKKSYHE